MEELLRVERDGASNSSSSSQANEVKELRRDKERTSSKGLSPDRSTGRRRGMLTLLCSVSASLAELRRVFEIKYFWFMGEIVTGGVGQMRTYGPRGQWGGRWPSVAPNLADSGGAMEGLGMEVAGACHKAAGTLTWGGGGSCMALSFG